MIKHCDLLHIFFLFRSRSHHSRSPELLFASLAADESKRQIEKRGEEKVFAICERHNGAECILIISHLLFNDRNRTERKKRRRREEIVEHEKKIYSARD
jgi:hypothetical protein